MAKIKQSISKEEREIEKKIREANKKLAIINNSLEETKKNAIDAELKNSEIVAEEEKIPDEATNDISEYTNFTFEESVPIEDLLPSNNQSIGNANKNITNYTREQLAIQTFKVQMEKYEKKILPELLLRHGIDPTYFKQIVISEVKRNEKLLQAFIANPASMFASILSGAEIGLIPSETTGEFFLIPRNLKQPDNSYKLTVTGMIGYKGIVNLILRSGRYEKVHTEVVYEGDIFEPVYGLEPNIIHKPNFNAKRTADKITFVYAVVKSKTGEYQFEVMTRDEIIAVQQMSKVENTLYFNDAKNPKRWMERKAALMQLSKMIEKDYYSKKAIQIDNMIQGGAYLTLDENDDVKIIKDDGNNIIQKKTSKRDIYGTFSGNNNIDNGK